MFKSYDRNQDQGKDFLGWHAYDHEKPINRECKNLSKSHTSTNFTDIVKKYQLWPIDISGEVKPDDLLYGIDIAMQTIWKNQHPDNCSASKFLISGNWGSGFGSNIHVDGGILGLSMNLGRVYLQNPIQHPHVQWQIDSNFCRMQKKLNLECYYHSWSSCTIYDALGPDALEILQKVKQKDNVGRVDYDRLKLLNLTADESCCGNTGKKAVIYPIIKRYEDDQSVILYNMGHVGRFGVIPFSLAQVIACSPMRKNATYYWWRAISATYILRPNEITLKWLHKNRIKGLTHDKDPIHIYIRRGDKAVEMALVATDAYTAAANIIWDNKLMNRVNGKNITHKNVVFASEDVTAHLEIAAASKQNSWGLYSATFFNRSVMDAGKTKMTYVNGIHHELEYLSMIHTLETAMISSGWVCTLGSNYCRLIDELRTTIGGKLRYPYADLSKETCREIPCIGSGIKYFDW